MGETRYISEADGKGKVIKQIPYEVSDEEVAEEQEQNVMGKAEDLIDSIGSMKDAKVFLKRLVRRLIKKGVLP